MALIVPPFHKTKDARVHIHTELFLYLFNDRLEFPDPLGPLRSP